MKRSVLIGVSAILAMVLVFVISLWPESGMDTKEELLTSYKQALAESDTTQLEKLAMPTSMKKQLVSRMNEFGGVQADQISFTINPETISPMIYEVTMKVVKDGTERTDLFYVQKVDKKWFLSFPHN